jgi:putative ABC transport system permease protein
VLAIVLVFALSLRLREREIQTIFKLGCSRSTVARLLGSEILIIVCASALIVGALMIALDGISNGLVRGLVIR